MHKCSDFPYLKLKPVQKNIIPKMNDIKLEV